MKIIHLKYIICLLTVTCISSGCKKYLDTPADNLRTPKTVADYTEMLNGEGWSRNLSANSDLSLYFLDMMTADVTESAGPTPPVDEKGPYSAFYTWQNIYDAQYDERHTPSAILNNTWLGLYRIIKVCNIITDEGNEIQGDLSSRQFLLGEAHFSRALAYYYLINIWGTPYDPANNADSMGVPLQTSSALVNTALPRSPVHVVYNQILEDLNNALSYVQASGKSGSIYHYSAAAVYLLLSRIHLYLQHWELAATFAGKCLEIKPVLNDITNQNNTRSDFYSSLLGVSNPEVIYTFYNDLNPDVFNIFGDGNSYGFTVSPELLQLYSATDQRLAGYFYDNNKTIIPKTFNTAGNIYCFSFRTAEAYLNRAEANAHLGETGKAQADIDLLKNNRVKSVIRNTLTSKPSLLSEVLAERRKELAFQLHNWFDLRRTNSPAMIHYFTPVTNQRVQPLQQFVLRKNDPGYTLEIPAKALQANPALHPLGLEARIPY
ncbi:RagB/SusD family nutrient uptake outer membrane protein [Chitinophaga sp. 22321]|uniref:RagB/SusD family nutrient uptake outer membrane protein n=1 Tax=Chitinophaga hostae TaxID=2831022 RepID=A0ABS5J879_9BACT|nr:RagB/SusD family nutrient uptake outer membrane protein [Chitinophaga hostae]MBS0031430.1 RagB/SusD family nutrient uptake outer membrane protein [Chitinophaga hostae]